MFQQNRKTILALIIPFFFLGSGSAMAAEEGPGPTTPVMLACSNPDPGSKLNKDGSFTLVAGQKPVFQCVAAVVDKEKTYDVMLLGKETDSQANLSSSSAHLSLSGDTPGQVTLQFPEVFRSGVYQFTFLVLDTKTQEVLSREVPLIGELKGTEQPHIVSAISDKEHYEWSAPLTLKVSLDFPGKQPSRLDDFFLGITLRGRDGTSCADLVKQQLITQVEDAYQLMLPEAGACTNTIDVTLFTRDGKQLDKKAVAIGLPEMKLPPAEQVSSVASRLSGMPVLLKGALILTGVLILVLIGYFLMKRKKRHF